MKTKHILLSAIALFAIASATTACEHGKNYSDPRGKTLSASHTTSPTPAMATSFGAGTWYAGKTIQEGRYRTDASFSTGKCVLTIRNSYDKFVARFTIVPGDSAEGVAIQKDQKVVVTGGCLWTRQGPNK